MNTSPTAADFAVARFAEHPDGRVAMRSSKSGTFPWDSGYEVLSDAGMFEQGWRIVTPAPEVDDAMVKRARESLRMDGWMVAESSKSLTRALRAALTPEPPRPEGAEEWDEELGEMPAAADLTPEQRSRLADALAERDHALGVHAPSRDCGRGPCCLEDGHDGECKL